MTPTDIALLAGELGPIIREYVARALAPLEQRNKELELRLLEFETRPEPQLAQPERGEKGERGDAGRDGVAPSLEAVVAAMLPLLPKAEKGERGDAGRDGRDAPAVDVAALESAVLARVPAPVPGAKGEQGIPGRDAPEVNVEALAARVAALVPVPKDGRDGLDGSSFVTGFGPPTLDGHDGDTYLDVKSGDVYQCR